MHVIAITFNAGLPDPGFRDLRGAAGVELASLVIYTCVSSLPHAIKNEDLAAPRPAHKSFNDHAEQPLD